MNAPTLGPAVRSRHPGPWILLGAFLALWAGVFAFVVLTGEFPVGRYPFFWPWFPFGFFLLFFFVFVALRWSLGGWGRGRWGYPGGWDTAREVLRRRYAAGEISRETYLEMLRVLEDPR